MGKGASVAIGLGVGTVVALGAVLLATLPVKGSTELATVTGMVGDIYGPLPGVAVKLGNLSTVTNTSGSFKFGNVSTGTYTMSFSKEGYKTVYL